MIHCHTILAIDDDQDDLAVLQEALGDVDEQCRVVTAGNGVAGLGRLEQMKKEGVLPCLILLDINMPVMDGRETFYAIKRDAALKHIPVVVFSTSSDELDKVFFSGKATSYVVKPDHYTEFLQVARQFLTYCQQ
jgi:CheY-like chemotaxis protein